MGGAPAGRGAASSDIDGRFWFPMIALNLLFQTYHIPRRAVNLLFRILSVYLISMGVSKGTAMLGGVTSAYTLKSRLGLLEEMVKMRCL